MLKIVPKHLFCIALVVLQVNLSMDVWAGEKRLRKCTTTEDHYSIALTYDDLTGRLISGYTSGIDSHWDSADDFTTTLDWSRIDQGIVTVSSDSRTGNMSDGDITLRLNAEGLLTEVVGAAGSQWEGTWNFILDQNGNCTRITSQEEGVYGNFTWVNGDFTSSQENEATFFYSGKSFSSPVPSKSSVVSAFFNSYSGGLSVPGTALLAGMVKGSRNLVDYIIVDGDMEYFVYEFDQDGYPVRIEQRLGHNGELYAEFLFEWEADPGSGINETTVAPAGEPCYISPDGTLHNRPVKGVNIVRHGDGTTRKIYIR